jgi:hypothetical protein
MEGKFIGPLTMELIARFLASHLMDVIGICYPQYWLQGDVEEDFYCHLELNKSHYCIEQCLEPIKILEANSSLEVAKIFPSIFYMSALDMQSTIFKITMKSNTTITMEAPFVVNPLTRLWWTLVEVSWVLRHSFFQINRNCNNVSVWGQWRMKEHFLPFPL